jgi:hypothetical protein
MKDNTEVIEAGAGSTAGGQAVTHEIELEDGAAWAEGGHCRSACPQKICPAGHGTSH